MILNTLDGSPASVTRGGRTFPLSQQFKVRRDADGYLELTERLESGEIRVHEYAVKHAFSEGCLVTAAVAISQFLRIHGDPDDQIDVQHANLNGELRTIITMPSGGSYVLGELIPTF